TGFGGGMGHTGGACGAVSGAVLVLGLLFGSTGPAGNTAKDETYALVRECTTRFSIRNGAVCCTHLLGCDLSPDVLLARSRRQSLARTTCPRYVRDAVEILEEIVGPRDVTSGPLQAR